MRIWILCTPTGILNAELILLVQQKKVSIQSKDIAKQKYSRSWPSTISHTVPVPYCCAVAHLILSAAHNTYSFCNSSYPEMLAVNSSIYCSVPVPQSNTPSHSLLRTIPVLLFKMKSQILHLADLLL
jgi:ABC-type multidrug transport system permease subunit